MRPRFSNPWTSEAELASAVRQALEINGWTVYPEANGFDLFATAGEGAGVFPNDQLGVECKLDAGTAAGFASLINQAAALPMRAAWPTMTRAVDHHWTERFNRGPQYRLAVAGRIAEESILRRLGVVPLPAAQVMGDRWEILDAEDLAKRLSGKVFRSYPRHSPRELLPVPELVVNVPAGVPSPSTYSPWKVEAVRLYLRLQAGELLTSEDLGRHVSTFRQRGWVKDTGERKGRLYLYTAGPGNRWDGYATPATLWPQIVHALQQSEGNDGTDGD